MSDTSDLLVAKGRIALCRRIKSRESLVPPNTEYPKPREIMKFGVNTFLFACPFTTADTKFFPQFAEWGFDGVEVVVVDPDDFDPVEVGSQLDRNGLDCAALCAVYPPGRDLRGTPEEQAACKDYMRKLIDIAPILNTDLIIGPIYSYVGRTEAYTDAERAEQWQTVVANLKEICEVAEAAEIRIGMEPLNRFETDMINTCDAAMQMVADVDSPALGLHLDTFHMCIEEKSLANAIRRAGDRLFNVHASGSDRGTPGNGHIDWAAVFAALKEIDYDGYVSIESFTQDVEVIARAASIWRKIEPSNEAIARDGVAFLRNTWEEVR